jgi:hypothetical protein
MSWVPLRGQIGWSQFNWQCTWMMATTFVNVLHLIVVPDAIWELNCFGNECRFQRLLWQWMPIPEIALAMNANSRYRQVASQKFGLEPPMSEEKAPRSMCDWGLVIYCGEELTCCSRQRMSGSCCMQFIGNVATTSTIVSTATWQMLSKCFDMNGEGLGCLKAPNQSVQWVG